MNKKDYIDAVLLRMNEAKLSQREGFEFEGGDNSEVVRHIEGVYTDAWRKCAEIVPASWLQVTDFSEHPQTRADGSGYLTIPTDWYKLYVFKMKGWQREVYRVAEENDEIGRLQFNPYTRGTCLHPVCVLGFGENQQRIISYYSLPKGSVHEVEKALYIPLCTGLEKLNEQAELKLDKRLEQVICYMAGGLVYRILGDTNSSQLLEREAIILVHGFVLENEDKKKV